MVERESIQAIRETEKRADEIVRQAQQKSRRHTGRSTKQAGKPGPTWCQAKIKASPSLNRHETKKKETRDLAKQRLMKKCWKLKQAASEKQEEAMRLVLHS